MKDILESIILNIVDDRNSVSITERLEDETTIFDVKVAENDMGKVIGKQGKTAKAIRTLIKSIATKEKKRVVVKFVE